MYEEIARRLNLDKKTDEDAAKTLNDLLHEPDIQGLLELVHGHDCVVLGAGPSLDDDLERLERAGYLDKILIAADGATSALLEYRNPDIIVTDLDGDTDHQLKAWHQGAWLVVHAHGDNIPRLYEIVPTLKDRVIGTTQVRPFGKLYNFGGFTDGDRAVFMAHELGASKIYLAGMDLGTKIGKYSGDKDIKRKLVKLEICKELLSWLAVNFKAPMLNLTVKGERIPHVRSARINFEKRFG